MQNNISFWENRRGNFKLWTNLNLRNYTSSTKLQKITMVFFSVYEVFLLKIQKLSLCIRKHLSYKLYDA